MKEYSVYPGKYIPLEETEILLTKLDAPGRVPFAAPLMNMDEYEDIYRIEIGLPGVQREDININTHENILSVIVLHKHLEHSRFKALQVHELENNCLERHIFLPVNADTEFISAEFRNGMLCVCVPKTNAPIKSNNHIVVY